MACHVYRTDNGQGQDLNSGRSQEGEKEGSQPAWVCVGSGRPGKRRHREGLWEGIDAQERRKAISCGENAWHDPPSSNPLPTFESGLHCSLLIFVPCKELLVFIPGVDRK